MPGWDGSGYVATPLIDEIMSESVSDAVIAKSDSENLNVCDTVSALITTTKHIRIRLMKKLLFMAHSFVWFDKYKNNLVINM